MFAAVFLVFSHAGAILCPLDASRDSSNVKWRRNREQRSRSVNEIGWIGWKRIACSANSCQTRVSRFPLMTFNDLRRNRVRITTMVWQMLLWIYRVVKATRKFIGSVNIVWLSKYRIEKLWVKIDETIENLRGICLFAILNCQPFIIFL